MIDITLFKRKEEIRGFICAGHAGYKAKGQDIVCAGVSALTCTCANALESVAHIRPKVKMGDGFLAVRIPNGKENHDAQVLLQGLYQGLRDLVAQYPTYIRLTIVTE